MSGRPGSQRKLTHPLALWVRKVGFSESDCTPGLELICQVGVDSTVANVSYVIDVSGLC